MIARRIGEYRSTTPLADGLRLFAFVEQFANSFGVGAGRALELEPRADEPLVIGSLYGAITDLIIGGLARVAKAATIEYVDFDHVAPRLLAPGAGIHRQRSTQGAGNAGKEFRGPQSPFHTL